MHNFTNNINKKTHRVASNLSDISAMVMLILRVFTGGWSCFVVSASNRPNP